MSWRAWLYFACLVGVASLCLATQGYAFAGMPSSAMIGAGVFVAVGLISEASSINFRVPEGTPVKSSLSHLPLFACAVCFPSPLTVAAGACVALISDLGLRRLRLWVAAFNASVYVVTLSASTYVYTAFGGAPITPRHLYVLPFFALAASYFAVNTGLVGGFLSVRSGAPVRHVLHQMTGPAGGNLLYDLLASPFALLVGWLYVWLGLGGIFLGMMPLLLVRYTYLYAIRLEHANSDLVRVLIKAIETRDPYTSGHSIRVSALARTIAQELNLGPRKVALVERAALLHDIGKIEPLYAAIISKPHELSVSEKAIIRSHPAKGADLLLQLSAFRDDEVVKGVRHHHERFDGNGYPDGLKGSSIPLPARIIMISDALDAMLSDRPYRRALDIESVKRELIRCAGDQFDPNIVKLVIECGTVERARELVREEPPDAMVQPALVAAAVGK